eukprot:1195304-Prorocentrum_minimum.AAC.10
MLIWLSARCSCCVAAAPLGHQQVGLVLAGQPHVAQKFRKQNRREDTSGECRRRGWARTLSLITKGTVSGSMGPVPESVLVS